MGKAAGVVVFIVVLLACMIGLTHAWLNNPFASHNAVGYAPTKVRNEDPEYTCPEGYNQNGKECSMLVTAKPEESCPFASKKTDRGCKKVRPILWDCPVGYSKKCDHHRKDNCRCILVVVKDKILGPCPEGTVMSGDNIGTTCEKEVLAPVIGKCPTGFMEKLKRSWRDETTTEKKLKCYSENYAEPKCSCSKAEAVMENGKCVHEEIYDCTNGKDYGRKLNPKRLKTIAVEHFNRGGGGANFNSALNHAGMYRGESKEGHYQTDVVSRTCKRSKFTNPVCKCPVGTLTVASNFGSHEPANKCKIVDYVDPLMYCSVDNVIVGDPEECYTTELVAAPYYCPEDYLESCKGHSNSKSGCKCVKVRKEEVIAKCGNGYELENDECTLYMRVAITCPEGYDWKHEGICEKIKTTPPIVRYTTTYSCVGKGCGAMDNHHAKKLKEGAHAKKANEGPLPKKTEGPHAKKAKAAAQDAKAHLSSAVERATNWITSAI